MSFDVFLQRFVGGEPAAVNRDRVRAVLVSREFAGPDQFGVYGVRFADGLHVEFSAKGLAHETELEGFAFHIRGISSELVQFIWEIAQAGDMVILPAMEDFVAIMSSPEQTQDLPSDLRQDCPHSVVCSSSEELESLLAGGFSGWKRYRNKMESNLRRFAPGE